ncbi:hypothetical protein ACFL5K_03505 [Gemmatimonadota bacterium]
MFFYMMVMKMILICFVAYIGLSYSNYGTWKQIQGVKTKNIPRTFDQGVETSFSLNFKPPRRIDSTNIADAFTVTLAVYMDSLKQDTLPNTWSITDQDEQRRLKEEDIFDASWYIGPLEFVTADSEGVVVCDISFQNLGTKYLELTLYPNEDSRYKYMELFSAGIIPVEVVKKVDIIPVTSSGIAHHPIEILESENIDNIYRILWLDSGENVTGNIASFVTIKGNNIFFKRDGRFRIWFSRPSRNDARGDFEIRPNRPPLFYNNSNTLTIPASKLGSAEFPNGNVPLIGMNAAIKDPEEDEFIVNSNPDNPLSGASFKQYEIGDGSSVTVLNCKSDFFESRKTHELIATDAYGSFQSLYITIYK